MIYIKFHEKKYLTYYIALMAVIYLVVSVSFLKFMKYKVNKRYRDEIQSKLKQKEEQERQDENRAKESEPSRITSQNEYKKGDGTK